MALTVDSVLASLSDLIGDQQHVVTYKWLSRHFNIPYDTSKRILFEFLTQQGQKVKATFLVSGWTKGASSEHLVRVVEGPQLDAAKAQLGVITALHVYSVQPTLTKDASDLYNADFAQTEDLFRKLLASPKADAEANPLAAGLLSAVQCAAAHRDPLLAAAARPQTVPQPKEPPAAVPKPAAVPTALPKKQERVPSAKSSPAGKSAMEKLWDKAPAGSRKQAEPSTREPAAKRSAKMAASVAAVENAGSDGEDEQLAAAGQSRKGSRAQMIEDSDGDDDFKVPPAKQAKQTSVAAPRKPKAAAKKPEAASAGAKRKKAAAGSEEGEKGGADAASDRAAKPPPGTKSGRAKMGEAAGKSKRRTMKTYFNDAGEEVTEMVEERGDEGVLEAPPAAPAPVVPEQPPQQQQQQAFKPAGAAPARAAGGKKAAEKAAAASRSRNIMSFFGKK